MMVTARFTDTDIEDWPMTTPTATVDRINLTRDVYLTITDGPVLTKHYGRRQFRVTGAHITYLQTAEVNWKWTGIRLSGPYVKTDGTDATNSTSERHYRMQDVAERGFWSLVEQHMPGAAL